MYSLSSKRSLYFLGTAPDIWLQKRTSDTIRASPREKPSPGDLNQRLPAADNTRPRQSVPKITTAAAFKALLRRFQNSLPVGYTTKPKDSFLPPHFSKLLENSSSGTSHQANGLFPASTSPKASRIFYPGLKPPKRTEFPSPLQVARSFCRKVLYLQEQGRMTVYLTPGAMNSPTPL
jgi:hypothetical protein